MPLDNYYFNISTRRWVRSFEEPTDVDAPVFGYKDNRDFSVTFLRSIGEAGESPVDIVPGTVSAKIGLNNGTTSLTTATSGAADNNAYPFVLPITGTDIDTLMSGKTTDQQVLCYFLITTSSGINRYKTTVFISPEGISATAPDPNVDEPSITMSQATGVLIPKERPSGMTETFVDRATGERVVGYVYNRVWKFDVLDS